MTTYKSLLQEVKAIKKLATNEYRNKLLRLLYRDDMAYINQAIELNDVLGILTDEEIGDILLSKVIDGNKAVKEHWKQDGLGWFLLEKYPNHPMWNNLKILNLNKNNLPSLPSSIGNLTNLKDLYLTSNNLTSLPSWIGNLKNLETLYLTSNNLTSLPSWIGNLKNLETLYLDRNNLTSLPKEIGNLTKLKVLGLKYTDVRLEDVPVNLRPITTF